MWRYLSGGRTVYRYRRAHRDAGFHRRRSSIGDNYAPSLEGGDGRGSSTRAAAAVGCPCTPPRRARRGHSSESIPIWTYGTPPSGRSATGGGGVVVGKSSPLPAVVPTFVVGDVWNPSSTAALCTPNSFDAIICDPPYNIGAPVLVDGQDSRPRNYHDKGHGFRRNESGESWGGASSPDIIPSILSIAANVLVMGGRIVFFLPVRGGDMTKSSEELLSLRGFPQDGGCDKSCPLRLLRHSSRRQNFSPTFSRWLVCMEKL